jgi:integrase
MPVNKTDSGSYRSKFNYQGKTYGKTFAKSRDAKAWEIATKTELEKGAAPDAFLDTRKISQLVERWNELHGHTIKSNNTYNALKRIADQLGDPRASRFKAADFIEYRKERLAAGTSPNMVNHELTYLKGMFNKLIEFSEWREQNPLGPVKKVTQYDKQMRYLETHEIDRLFQALDNRKSPHPRLISELCLCTGMRWNEANELRRESLIPAQNKITLVKTKNGKSRTVLINQVLMNRLLDQGETYGRLFPLGHYKAFSNALDAANIKLPDGQNTHVLRHTFASHYVINGGRIEALQKILGHSTILMTMKYAHLAPDYMDTMTILNPVDYKKPK